jgi:SulP family sulfate permease
VLFTSLQPAVRRMLGRAGLIDLIGEQNIYWSAAEAIVAAHNHHATSDCEHCQGLVALDPHSNGRG